MSMTFYIGSEIKAYQEKWDKLVKHYSPELTRKNKNVSNASVFRYLVDKLDKELERINGEGEK